MSFSPFAGVRVWDDAEAADIPAASFAQADSIDDQLIGKFATVAARNTATTALRTLHPGATGMQAYVTGVGMCFYDGNGRAGSGGWTWLSSPVIISNPPEGIGATASTTPDEIVNSGSMILTSKRLLHVVTWASVYSDSGTVLARVFLTGTGIVVPVSDQQELIGNPSWAPTAAGNAYRRNAAQSFYATAGPGTVSLSYRVLRVDGGSTNAAYATGKLQVVDMGPSD